MIDRLVREKEEAVRSNGVPHLSHSRINRYLLCPEQYRLYYIEGMRPRFYSAALVFGQTVHQALAALFKTGANPMETFTTLWHDSRPFELRYGARESWEKLRETGRELLAKFVLEEVPRISAVSGSEKPFEFGITDIESPFVGVIDLVAVVDGKKTVVDFKTSGSTYAEHENAEENAAPKAIERNTSIVLNVKPGGERAQISAFR